MKKLVNLRRPSTPKLSLRKQMSWLPDRAEKFPKSVNSSLTIALLSGDRLYWSMEYEGNVVAITEKNWRWVLKYCDVDLLLIESCSETATGDWFRAQTAPELEDTSFARMVTFAREQRIPVAYWFTLDEEYLPQYEQLIDWMGSAYCADSRVVDTLERQGVPVVYLPPAVQPALFTKLNQHTLEKRELYRVICDDLVDAIQSWEGRERFYQELEELGGYFFDSRNQVWSTKVKSIDLMEDRLIGSVDFLSRVGLFKEARTLAVTKSRSRTRTDIQWSVVEAAASHATVLLEPEVDVGEYASICLRPSNRDQFFVELVRHDKDNLYFERLAQKAWRETLMNHTFSHRVRAICKHQKIKHSWVEYPSAGMVTPSYRKKFLPRVESSFTRQTYPNKCWVMAFNGPKTEFEGVKEEVEKLDGAKAIYVPSELHAGPCMNAGIQHALAEYVFRMDDDDYYGDNYLLDMMLYRRVVDFDVIGKSFRVFYAQSVSENEVFYRSTKALNFKKPAVCLNGKIPEGGAYVAGCSHGGRKIFFLQNPYPERNFGSVDVQWMHSLKSRRVGTILCADDCNLVVDRRIAKDHTWDIGIDTIAENAKRVAVSSVEDVYV